MPICRIYNSNGTELLHFNPTSSSEKHHWTVGRSSSCDVCLKRLAETSVSRQHFTMDYDGNAWNIHDTSRAGLVYNGEHITDMRLENGMVFRFGQLFVGIGEKAVPSKYRISWGRTSNQSGVLWHGVNEIGASHDNTVMIREGDVARKHCHIRVADDGELFISNVSALVNTEINGVQLRGTNEMPFSPDDRITLAGMDVEIDTTSIGAYRGETILSEDEIKIRNSHTPLKQQVKVLHVVLLTLVIIAAILFLAMALINLMPAGS